MTDDKPYVDDIGTRIRTYLFTNMSQATKIEYHTKKPDNVEVIWSCSIEDIGLQDDAVVYFDTISGSIDLPGNYKIQTYAEFTNGNRFLSRTKNIVVYEAYK